MAGEYMRDLASAYRVAYHRLLYESYDGNLEEAIADSPEINNVHFRHKKTTPGLTPLQQERTDARVKDLMAEILGASGT